MKKNLLIILSLFGFLFGNAQKSKLTIHNKNGFVSQTGYLSNGYKEGQWININRRNDTSFYVYKKDKLVYKEIPKKYTYGKFKGKTVVQKFYTNYNKTSISNYNVSICENEITTFSKSLTCPYYSKPYYKYQMIGDSRNLKTIVQQFDLTMTVYPLKDNFGTKYDKNLKKKLPHLSKIEFEIDPDNGYRYIKDLSIYYNGQKIDQSKNGVPTEKEGDRYEILSSESYFFQEESVIALKKNGILIFKEIFFKGMPVSFASFHDNGNPDVSLTFKNGLPHGKYSSYHENGEKGVSCFFEDGVLQGNFDYYNPDRSIKFLTQFIDGRIDGKVQGSDRVLLYKDGVILQSIVENNAGEVIKWTSGYNSFKLNKNIEDVKIDGVKYQYDRVKKRYTQFFYHAGDEHFRYTDYGKQNFILINYQQDKNNWFSLYLKSDGEIKDDINLNLDGKNYRKEAKKVKLKLIKKHFFNVKKFSFPDILKIVEFQDGETIVRQTFLPTGTKCLEERFVKGKLTGKRLMWGLKGNLTQEVNYLNNHNEGNLTTYNAKGEIIESGSYKNGVKNGEWRKVERDVLYSYYHENSNTAKTIKSYFKNGDLKSVYTKTDSGNYQIQFNEDGSRKSEYFRNKRGKTHGPFFNSWGKGKTVKGNYVNGYQHGEFLYFNEKGKLENKKYFDYGRVTTKAKTKTLNSDCACPQEFNARSGSVYYPALHDLIDYKSFSSMYSNIFYITEENYNKVYMKGMQTSHSGDNTTRFFGFDWIGLSKKNALSLVQFQGVDLMITPCKKTGEIANRNMTINYTHRLERYSSLFDEEVEDFKMTSKNIFLLVLEMSNVDEEDFLRQNYPEIEKLSSLIKYLNKKGFKIETTSEYNDQIIKFYDYIEEEDKFDEFFNQIYLKDFNHGILDKKKNPRGYRNFETAMNQYFYEWLRGYSTINQIKKYIIDYDASMEIDGGRYAFSHPSIIHKSIPTPLFFNCKLITVREKLNFKEIKDICIQPKTYVKGTKFEIQSVNGIAIINNQLVWSCTGNYKGVFQKMNFEIRFDKSSLSIKVPTRLLKKSDSERLMSEGKGTYNPNNESIEIEIKTPSVRAIKIKK